MQRGVGHTLQSRIPLAVEQREREVVEFRDDDAVLVVRKEKMRCKVVVLEPRSEEVEPLGIPLIPVRHVGAESVECRPMCADDDEEKTD